MVVLVIFADFIHHNCINFEFRKTFTNIENYVANTLEHILNYRMNIVGARNYNNLCQHFFVYFVYFCKCNSR